jgi:hypothetical protein
MKKFENLVLLLFIFILGYSQDYSEGQEDSIILIEYKCNQSPITVEARDTLMLAQYQGYIPHTTEYYENYTNIYLLAPKKNNNFVKEGDFGCINKYVYFMLT